MSAGAYSSSDYFTVNKPGGEATQAAPSGFLRLRRLYKLSETGGVPRGTLRISRLRTGQRRSEDEMQDVQVILNSLLRVLFTLNSSSGFNAAILISYSY